MIRDPELIEFWCPIITVYFLQMILCIVALIIKDNSIVGIFWGFNIAMSNTVILLVNNNWQRRTISTLVLIWTWAIRMTVYVVLKRKGEDWRFTEMKHKWFQAGGQKMVVFMTIVMFFMAGTIMVLVGSSTYFIAIYSHEDVEIFIIDRTGWGILAMGMLFELISDIQLLIFKRKPQNKDKILKLGFWRISRHPNLFFEAVVWWGVYIAACSVPYGYVTIWSAIGITVIIRYFSGVPLIEKKLSNMSEFKIYKRETNIFIPW